MSDPVFEKFAAAVLRDAHLSRAKADELRRELRAHFEDCIEYEMSCGLSRAEAVRRALDELGDPRTLAHEMERPYLLRRNIMRTLTAAACLTLVVTGANFLSSSLPAARPGPGSTTALAQISGGVGQNPGAIGEGGWDRPIEHVDLKDVPLSDAFEYIHDLLGSNLVVRWQQLEALGINRDRPVNLHLKNVTVRKLLELVMGEIGDKNVAFQERDNVTLITSRDDQQGEMITRVYDVRDLIRIDGALDKRAAEAAYGQAADPKSLATAGTKEARLRIDSDPILRYYLAQISAIQSEHEKLKITNAAPQSELDALVHKMDEYHSKYDDRRAQVEQEIVAELGHQASAPSHSDAVKLVEVIQGAVEPDCWSVNGGRGFADIFSGALVVRQSPEMHRHVMRFLDELRTVVKTPAGAVTPQ